MYLVSERQTTTTDVTNISKTKRIKMIVLNLWILLAIIIDLAKIKKQAFIKNELNFIELGLMMSYFLGSQCYGSYRYCQSKNKLAYHNRTTNIVQNKQQQISIQATILWHVMSLMKLGLVGICLSNNSNTYTPAYFLVRLTIYSSALFIILSHLRMMCYFVLVKGQLQIILHKHGEWMLRNFWIIFYFGIIGINLDVISYGNDINYYVWVILMSGFLLHLVGQYVRNGLRFNPLVVFQSE